MRLLLVCFIWYTVSACYAIDAHNEDEVIELYNRTFNLEEEPDHSILSYKFVAPYENGILYIKIEGQFSSFEEYVRSGLYPREGLIKGVHLTSSFYQGSSGNYSNHTGELPENLFIELMDMVSKYEVFALPERKSKMDPENIILEYTWILCERSYFGKIQRVVRKKTSCKAVDDITDYVFSLLEDKATSGDIIVEPVDSNYK